jgi:hypothetical protein
MQIIIEDADIATVKESGKRYGVALTDDQAKSLIESNNEIVAELLGGCIDDDSIIASALVDLVMKDVRKKDRYRWVWPDYGSEKSYKEEFYSNFKKAAMEKGFTLIGDWE